MVIGPVTVGVRPSLPVQGVALILGNDLAGQRVISNNIPVSALLVPTYAVTQAIAKRKAEATQDDDGTDDTGSQGEPVDQPHIIGVSRVDQAYFILFHSKSSLRNTAVT